ncbi:MAG TPA: HAMP domain-containing sensor histidine kinase [Longimicrobiales bacterium]|nr:HAMP domain-containing sensor histidine kinase [Longimicrobiales bacterium]
MRSLSLRWRLLLWASAASAVTLIMVIVLIDVTFRANIRNHLVEGLTFARQVARDARASQMEARISETVTNAMDTRLRAAVATGDPATISQTLEEIFAEGGTAWASVIGTDGSLLASTPGAPRAHLSEADSLVEEALYFDTGDLWVVGEEMVEVGASAILFGASPLAVLVTGGPVSSEQVTDLEAAVGRPVAVLAPGSSILGMEAAGIPGMDWNDLQAWHGGAGDAVELLLLGEERFFVAATPMLSRDGQRRGTMVLLGSYDEALLPSKSLRAALIGIFAFGLLLTLGVSGVFSRAITVPVGRLLRETERLAQGDLEHTILPLRDDEIGRLAESFEEMRVSLKVARADLIRAERLSAIGTAASALAHDFTQPLSAIAGAVGLLRMDTGAPDGRDRLFEAIDGELERLQRMKQEIVEFARGESTLDEGVVRIDSFLENTVSALRTSLAQRDIVLTTDHGYAGDWYIDSYRLERVIENLIRNSAAAISEGGRVSVRSTCVADALVIEVEDDGPGISPDELDEIFEPFVSFGKKEGTGLGLAIARNVVLQHAGTIEVTSRPGCTRFSITLPRRTGAAAPRQARAHATETT